MNRRRKSDAILLHQRHDIPLAPPLGLADRAERFPALIETHVYAADWMNHMHRILWCVVACIQTKHAERRTFLFTSHSLIRQRRIGTGSAHSNLFTRTTRSEEHTS